MEVFNPNANVPFLKWRKISVGISIVLMILSLGLVATRGLHYALDFTGGVMVEVAYEEPVAIADVREALTAGGFESAIVQSLGNTRELSIRLPLEAMQEGEAAAADAAAEPTPAAPTDQEAAPTGEDAASANESPDELASEVLAALQATRSDVSVKRHAFISSQVGDELKSDGLVAALFVIIGIMIYIGIRFEKRFAIAAVASEFHDAILTVGFFSLTQIDFDLTVLASLLAVIGYSINDKVVVFDRVRELFRLARKGEPEDILNRAINNTLSRTIITSVFTGITMIALYFFGGPPVHGFALTMIVGIVIGTLSSIFFANPILLWLGVSKKDLMPVTRDNPELAARP